MDLSGSDLNVSYLLYTNGVATGQGVDGTGAAITFGPQSGTGVYTVLATNNLTAGVSWMNGSAVVNVLLPPTITSEPAPVVAATNSSVVYTIAAAGSGLHYQWYRNGAGLTDDGHVSGSTTPLLTITPVMPADAAGAAAGYYCVITNHCGDVAVSTTNALTIEPANNLVWQGGNPDNSWDIATTPNWSNGGTAAVFNTGDNVTFDDTFVSPVVNPASPYLSPGTMTFNSSATVTLVGSGNIFGVNSSLNAIGIGVLVISNANSYAGGTTISNSYVQIHNYGALGSGPVNLAAGSLGTTTLWIPMKGSASAGLNNTLNWTGDSTLQFDGTGTYGCVLFGALTGTSGATLTITHSGASDDRLRVYNTNFTCNANLNLNGSFQLAPYNDAGSQVYNGVISGFAGLVTRNSGGTIMLNNTNSYSGGTTLSLGGVGIGSDSASDMSYGPFGIGSIYVDTSSGNSTVFAAGGPHTVNNPLYYITTTTNVGALVVSGSNTLTLSGTIDLSSQVGESTPTNRTIQVTSTAPAILSGSISDSSLGCGIIKTGNGVLYLDGADYYSGPTIVSAGRLAGAGNLVGPVDVQTNGVIGGGSAAAIGTLTVNNNLTIEGGGFFRLNKSLAQPNDMVSVSGVLTNAGTGTITVTNLGPALVIGDSFTLFSGAVSNGVALTVTGGGMNWTNKLAVDGSIQALSVASTIANYPTNLTFHLSGNTLTIGWPATHLGWILQTQTNALTAGLTTPTNTWHDLSGSAAVTQTNLGINPANPAVFFRLRHP